MRQRAAGHVQEFQHLIETRRVRVAFQHDRKKLLQVLAEQARFAQRFARTHPVDVAAQGIDFAVVGDKTERVRERPGRKGIGRETLMDQRQRAVHTFVTQVREDFVDLVSVQHALVDKSAVRQAGHIKQCLFLDAAVPHRMLDTLADHVELAFKGFFADDIGTAPDEELAETRLAGARGRPDHGVVARHLAPTEQDLTFFLNDALELCDTELCVFCVTRQEHQAGAVMTESRQFETERGAGRAQESIGHLNQDAGTVAGIFFATARTAVLKIGKDGQGLTNDCVRLATLHVDNEADSTGVMLLGRIVQPVRRAAGPRKSSASRIHPYECLRAASRENDAITRAKGR